MARVPYINFDDLSPPVREKLTVASRSNITRALANSPNVAITSGGVARYIRTGNSLDPRLRELALLQVGYSARNAYEYAHHIEIGFQYGVTEADIRAIAAERAGRPSHLEPLAKAVLRGAHEMTVGSAMSAATFAELQSGLGNEHLIELIFAIATYTGVAKMLATLQVDLEDEYQKYMEQFPFADQK